ncbi:hypothetical protein P167DRAFT_270068 [Morchella conica CCBAS932]|uniref:Uncharacterized protein n=1 Tax=Morchella conica CCBAS932 TaxID=1392247 RepID=A0A3N4KIC3_9PEZI|nr:hypothetical protein P167DRAFT_270068 [Morchella conica CCBAS932]
MAGNDTFDTTCSTQPHLNQPLIYTLGDVIRLGIPFVVISIRIRDIITNQFCRMSTVTVIST